MTHSLPRPTVLAQMLLADGLKEGDVAIDATAGNGYDSVFLAERVGSQGRVMAFDVQEEAIASTRKRLLEAGIEDRVELVGKSHARMGDHAGPESVAAVMFNLGYLPGADHAVATGDDTIAGLEAAAVLLKRGGQLSVVCYPGHQGGEAEAAAVEAWMTALPARGWRVVRYGAVGTLRPAPFLMFAIRG